LERVLGVVSVVEHTATDAQDHRSVTADQRLERRLFPAGEETVQQFPVRQPTAVFSERGAAKVLDDGNHLAGCHVAFSGAWLGLLLFLDVPGTRPMRRTFF
jgi:hypothetical protein